MTDLQRPLPIINEANEAYWSSARSQRLKLPKCLRCGEFFYPLTTRCSNCLSNKVDWKEVSGRATIVSWNVMHQLYDGAFADLIPYIVGVVQLEEGPRLVTNIVNCEPSCLRVGLPVIVQYLRVTDDFTLPVYRPQEARMERDTDVT